jgi:WD40 repeat protein
MVDKDSNNIYKSFYLGAVPSTEKTFRTQLSVSADNSLLAYCVGNVVIVRKQANDLKDGIVIFNRHKFKTTCVDIAPNGVFAASCDEQGNLKVWFLDDGTEKFSFPVLSSKILGVHWNDKSNRILVYGYGGNKGYARYVSWDTCNSMGEITGMTKNSISGDIKLTKPYFAVVASEDLSFRVYSGNNLMPKYVNKDHKQFICNVKFSPAGDKFVTVGLDKRISFYETESGNLISEFAKDFEGQHTNGIIGVSWLNENFIVTSSMDKTVKIWDLTNKTNKTLRIDLSEKDVGSDDEMQSGLTIGKEYIISLSLNGTLNLWSLANFTSSPSLDAFSEFPNKRIFGHQAHINLVKYNFSQKKLYSADISGRISK